MSINITWSLPKVIKDDTDYTQIQVSRGTDENNLDTFAVISTIDRLDISGNEILSYIDTDPLALTSNFYFVRYYDVVNVKFSRMSICIFELTPKEQRLVDSLRSMLDPIINSKFNDDGSFEALSDTDMMLGIKISVGWFNSYSPVTGFSLSNFPKDNESILLYMAQIATLLNKYVGLSLRDFGYSDNGISLTQNFAPAIQQAISQSMSLVNSLLALTKMEYASDGCGVGTLQLPIGMGGAISKGISSILNVFSMSGR